MLIYSLPIIHRPKGVLLVVEMFGLDPAPGLSQAGFLLKQFWEKNRMGNLELVLDN